MMRKICIFPFHLMLTFKDMYTVRLVLEKLFVCEQANGFWGGGRASVRLALPLCLFIVVPIPI